MPGRIIERTVTIADGESLSEEINLGDVVLVAIQPDSAWNTNIISFKGRTEDNALGDLKHEGTEVVAAGVVALDYITLNPAKFAGIKYLQVRSGDTGTPANQSGDSILTLVLRGIQ